MKNIFFSVRDNTKSSNSSLCLQEPSQGRYYNDYEGEEGSGTGDNTKGVKSNLIVSQTQPFKLTDTVSQHF